MADENIKAEKENEELTAEEKLRLINRVMETAAEDGCFEKALNLKAVSISDGASPKMCFAFEADQIKMNRYGALHGGLISSILDEAMGMAATIFSEHQVATTSFSLNYHKGGLGRTYMIEVEMEHLGRKLIHACAKLYDTENDKLCATGLGSYSVTKFPLTVRED